MPVFLITSSERVVFQEYIEADDENLARIYAMERHHAPTLVAHEGYGVDRVEVWDDDLPAGTRISNPKNVGGWRTVE